MELKSWNFGIVILAPSKFHDVEIPSFLQKSWNREFEAQTRKLGIVILALKFCPPLLRIPKFPIPLPAPSAPCKPRIPKFPIPIPAPSAPCKPRIPKFPIAIPAPSASCKPAGHRLGVRGGMGLGKNLRLYRLSITHSLTHSLNLSLTHSLGFCKERWVTTGGAALRGGLLGARSAARSALGGRGGATLHVPAPPWP